MLDDTLLADPRALAALDTGGVLRSAATAGAQVRSAAHGAQEAGVAACAGTGPARWCCVRRPRHLRRGGGMLTALLGPVCPVPVVTVDAVPSWIGPLDVVLAHTADATDADLADGVGRAVRRGAEVVLSAPHDGPVAAAGAGRVRLVEPRIPVPPGLDLPRGAGRGARRRRGPRAAARAALARPGRARRPARRRGRAQPARPRAVHEPGQVARAAARRAHPAAVGHRPAAAAVAGHAAAALATHAGVVAHAADIGRGPPGRRRAVRWTSTPAGATSSTTRSPTTRRPEAPPPRLVLIATAEEDPRTWRCAASAGSGRPPTCCTPSTRSPAARRNAALLRAAVLRLPARRRRGLPGPGHPHDRTRLTSPDPRRPAACSPRRPPTERRKDHRGAAGATPCAPTPGGRAP